MMYVLLCSRQDPTYLVKKWSVQAMFRIQWDQRYHVCWAISLVFEVGSLNMIAVAKATDCGAFIIDLTISSVGGSMTLFCSLI